MADAGVARQLVEYGHAVHCFADEHTGTDASPGCANYLVAAKESWLAMRDLFKQTLR